MQKFMNVVGSPSFWWHFAPVTVANAILLTVIFLSKNWKIQLASQIGLLALGHFAFGAWYIDALPEA